MVVKNIIVERIKDVERSSRTNTYFKEFNKDFGKDFKQYWALK
ncbi:MAG: hypothetical protein ACFFEN_09025 [Candidatus Thorarchaeota archaeon]